tara:strand:+ start:433 stop:801 length:369 start_codon:yes stop_codon:yes gene_type:complete
MGQAEIKTNVLRGGSMRTGFSINRFLDGFRSYPMRTPGGNNARDQWIHSANERVWFTSYGTTIAEITTGNQVILHAPYWNMYSQTTNRYLLQFLGLSSISEVRENVATGEYWQRTPINEVIQ